MAATTIHIICAKTEVYMHLCVLMYVCIYIYIKPSINGLLSTDNLEYLFQL